MFDERQRQIEIAMEIRHARQAARDDGDAVIGLLREMIFFFCGRPSALL